MQHILPVIKSKVGKRRYYNNSAIYCMSEDSRQRELLTKNQKGKSEHMAHHSSHGYMHHSWLQSLAAAAGL